MSTQKEYKVQLRSNLEHRVTGFISLVLNRKILRKMFLWMDMSGQMWLKIVKNSKYNERFRAVFGRV